MIPPSDAQAWVLPTALHPHLRRNHSVYPNAATHRLVRSSPSRTSHLLPWHSTLTQPGNKPSSLPGPTAKRTPAFPESFFVNAEEAPERLPLNVLGTLPPYLANSAYYLNGPGLFNVKHKDGKEFETEHWFDGLSMIHAFRFDAASNGVTYQSRFTSDSTKRAIQSVPKDHYRAIHLSMRQRPESAFGRLMHAFGPLTKDPKLGEVPFNTSVTLEKLPTRGILNARTDANVIHKLDPETLRVTDRYDFSYFSPELDKSMCLSHGALDDVTGEYFNCMANYSPVKTEYTVFRIDSSGKANILAKVKDFTYYMHSLALTTSYVIMAMGPAQIDLFPLLRGKSFTEACEMRPNTPTRFVVISRQSGSIVAEYEHEQFFNFHTFNAFEQDGDIMIDLSLFRDCKILQELRIDNMTGGGNVARAIPVRFTLPGIADLGARHSTSIPKASSRVLADVALEFATVSPRKRERPYRYVFGVSDNEGAQFSSSVAKVNVDTGIVTSYVLPQRTFGEPSFVPDPSGTEEDAGCLVVLALDNLKDSSALLVLDARTMTEVARAELPMRLPPSFHGAFHT